MVPTFACGFECAVPAGTANVGQHWFVAAGGGGSIQTATVRTSSNALRANPSSHTSLITTTTLGSSNIFVMRFYLRFATLPSADTLLATPLYTAAQYMGLGFKQSDSKLYAAHDTGNTAGAGPFTFGASGVAVTTGIWYRIDLSVDVHANPWTCDAQIDGTAVAQDTNAVAATTNAIVLLGSSAAVSMDAFFDDFILSNTAVDYPIGAGHVNSYVPAGDGTHTATSTHVVKGTLSAPTAGGNVTTGTTDSFNWVNGRPLLGGATDNTRLINQQTAASAEYAEHTIEQDAVETTAPRAVEVVGAHRQASTSACDSHFKVVDSGSETVVFDQTSNGVASDRFFTKQFATMPNGGAAWTLARFKALRLRFGYSSDATPDVYCRGWMIEAEFADPVTAFTDTEILGRPDGDLGARGMMQLLAT
jgi:hypothetical protein